MRANKLPTLGRLFSVFILDEDSGLLIWKTKQKVAGYSDHRGYRGVSLDRKKYWAHRIIFAMFNNCDPGMSDIDHIDGDKSNNRPSNLRIATRSQNTCNQGARKNNKSHFKGVSPNGSGFSAQITVRGKCIHLGTFKTPRDAHSAYCSAAERLHGKFARSQ